MKITEVSKYRVVRERMEAVVNILNDQPELTLYDKSGLLNRKLIKMLPKHLQVSRQGPLTTNGLWGTLQKMEEAGWIKTEVNGKRTFKITLIDYPTGWQPLDEHREDVQVVIEPTTKPEHVLPVRDSITPESVISVDDGMDGRPGRLAARLEKNIPELVEQGVTNAIFSIVSKMFPQVVPEVDTEAIDRLIQVAAELEGELQAERNAGQVIRENYNAAMRKSGAVYETSPIRPSNLEKAVQPLAKHAIDNGWTIHRTNSGHIMFRSPDGKPYFHGSTSSDTRSVQNAASDMYRMGLPRMP